MAKKSKNIKYKKMLPATTADISQDDGFKPYDFEPVKSSIQNFEFFNIFHECNKKKKDNDAYYSFDLYKIEKNYPSKKRKYKRAEELSKDVDKISREITFLTVLSIVPAVFGLAITVVLIINLLVEIFKPSGEDVNLFTRILKFVLKEIVLVGIIFAISKISSWQKHKRMLESHPYYELGKNLTMMDASRVTLTYPTKRIEENYRKFKSIISEEWRITSHDFITNRWFRMKPFEYDFPRYGRYIFYVEVKYKSCFPDYPALISIEDELQWLSFLPKDDDRVKMPLSDYKSMIRKRIKELIDERIPAMEVEEISVEAGCTGHENTKRGPKFRSKGEKPAYMETDGDREGKIILQSDMIKNLEKYRKDK